MYSVICYSLLFLINTQLYPIQWSLVKSISIRHCDWYNERSPDGADSLFLTAPSRDDKCGRGGELCRFSQFFLKPRRCLMGWKIRLKLNTFLMLLFFVFFLLCSCCCCCCFNEGGGLVKIHLSGAAAEHTLSLGGCTGDMQLLFQWCLISLFISHFGQKSELDRLGKTPNP